MEKHTQTIRAVDESNHARVIHVFQKVIDTSNMREGRSQTLGKLKDARTAEGEQLHTEDGKTFRVIGTGETLRAVE